MGHTKIVNVAQLPWDEDGPLALPEGVRCKTLDRDESSGRVDLIVQFPKGYVEPRHTHASCHSGVILAGKMLIHGKVLEPGDYLFGPANEAHGPMEYPEGCTVFASFYGNPAHQY